MIPVTCFVQFCADQSYIFLVRYVPLPVCDAPPRSADRCAWILLYWAMAESVMRLERLILAQQMNDLKEGNL